MTERDHHKRKPPALRPLPQTAEDAAEAKRPGPKGHDAPEGWRACKRHGVDAVEDGAGRVVAVVHGLREIGLDGTRRRAAMLASSGRIKEQLARAVRILMSDPGAGPATYEAVADMERVMAESD